MVGGCWGGHRMFFNLHRLRAGNGDSKSGASRWWERDSGEIRTRGLGKQVGQVEQHGRAVGLGTTRAGGSARGSRRGRG